MTVEAIKGFITSSKKVLLLQGSTASGKTFYCKQLIAEHQAIYIHLNKDRLIVERTLQEQKVAVDQKMLLVLDGYENLGELHNIHQYFNLHQWPNAKVIVTCRPEYFANVRDYRVYFAPMVKQRFAFNLLMTEMLSPAGESLPAKLRDKPPNQLIDEWITYHKEKHKLDAELEKQVLEYCIAIATEMQAQKITKIIYKPSSRLFSKIEDPWQKYFSPEFTRVRMACPIIKTGEHQYEFINSSLIAHFAAMKSVSEAKEISVGAGLVPAQMLTGTHKGHPYINHYLNHRLIVRDVNMLSLLADRVWQDERFKAELFELVLASRQDEKMAVAAANAITILNTARVPFSGMNLSGIRIPSAILPEGVFDHTNFTCSDLSNVELPNAYLGGAILCKSKSCNLDFKERPYVELNKRANEIIISPDGNWLAARRYDIDIWNLVNFEKTSTIKTDQQKHFGPLTFNSSGSLFVSTYIEDGKSTLLRFSDLKDGRLIKTIKHPSLVTKISFSKNGLYFLALTKVGNGNTAVVMWGISDNKVQEVPQTLSDGKQPITDFDICHQTRWLAISYSSDIDVLDILTQKRRHLLTVVSPGESSAIIALRFQKHNSFLMSLTRNGIVIVWNAEEGIKLQTIVVGSNTENKNWISAVFLDFNGLQFATWDSQSSERNKIIIWDALTGEKKYVFYGESDNSAHYTFSPDGKHLFALSIDNTKIRILDILNSIPSNLVGREYLTRVKAIGVMSHANCVYFLNHTGIVQTWCLQTNKFLRQQQLVQNGMSSDAKFSQLGHWLAIATVSEKENHAAVAIYEMRGTQAATLAFVFDERAGQIVDILFSSNEIYIAIRFGSGALVIYDLRKRLKQSTIGSLKEGEAESLAFIQNAQQLLAIDSVGGLRIYDVITGNLLNHFRNRHAISGWYSYLSRDGDFIVFYTKQWIVLHNRLENNNHCLEEVDSKGNCNVKSVYLSPGNKYLAVCRTNKIVTIFYLKTKKSVNLYGWFNSPDVLCFDQNNQYLIIASDAISVADSIKVFRINITEDENIECYLQQHLPPRLNCWNCDITGATDLDFLQAGVLKQRGAKGLADFDPLLANRATLLNVLKQRVKNDPKPIPVSEAKVVAPDNKQNKSSVNKTVISMLLASSLMSARQLTTPGAQANQQSEIHRRLQQGFLGRMSNSLFSPAARAAASAVAPAQNTNVANNSAGSAVEESNKPSGTQLPKNNTG